MSGTPPPQRIDGSVTIRRCFYNIITDDVEATSDFYRTLLGFSPTFSSRWYISLKVKDSPLELGILKIAGDVLPADAHPGGGLLTCVVDDVARVFAAAQRLGVEIVEPPRDLFYGVRRLVLKDPAGTLVDVSSECAPDPDWMKKVQTAADGSFVED